ncbi:hypothetical protein [Herbiconiux daphne]|uniref:Uncharacterized protein n=1 Tax=Herbiconiux daphne TaxID=2970914 RepID=A0ABT2GZI2_9MICO|nr:hypothetical protein [Herbiconiux daphne]MCS5733374.1 hypothetical protein [Herbiconiux daphne]
MTTPSTPSSSRPTAIALGLIALALLSGCSTSPGSTSATDSAERTTPLSPYYAALYPAIDDETQQRQNAAVQDAVAVCMKEQGFDYQPDTNSGVFTVDSESLDAAPGSEEFAKTYGYGVSTDPFGTADHEASVVDPNQAYVDSLSDGERSAYDAALWGAASVVSPTDDPSGGTIEATPYDWTTAGCFGAAQHDVTAETDPSSDPAFASMVDAMSALYEKVRAAPDVREKEKDWSDCLARAGFPGLEHIDDPQARFNELLDSLTASPDGSSTGERVRPDPSALKKLQSEEIATASADYDCVRDTGYQAALDDAQTTIEQAFVDENKEQLDALVAKYGAR